MTWQGEHGKFLIGGEWATPRSDDRISVVSPYTEEEIATVPAAGHADLGRGRGRPWRKGSRCSAA